MIWSDQSMQYAHVETILSYYADLFSLSSNVDQNEKRERQK